MMQEAARAWLHCPSNSRVTGFRTVAELYLLHVLIPLGHREEALELIGGEIGSSTFTEDQRQTALEILEEKEQKNREPIQSGPNPRIGSDSETPALPVSTEGLTFISSPQSET